MDPFAAALFDGFTSAQIAVRDLYSEPVRCEVNSEPDTPCPNRATREVTVAGPRGGGVTLLVCEGCLSWVVSGARDVSPSVTVRSLTP